MNGGIFLIQSGGDLVEMKESRYETEDVLQELLARYPNLLAGDQMNSQAPRRWLLVTREMGVPCEEDGSDRWSLDHLFLDQDAVPTLVEVKRSSDNRIRREVVGQMLDYAANAVVYWPVETIRAKFEQRVDFEKAIEVLLGIEANVEEFWLRVKENLANGRVRMVFVADEIPPELRRIVEFLNDQMDPAEVLAVEIKQFVGPDLKTLVPRVIGQTAKAEMKKSASQSSKDYTKYDVVIAGKRHAGLTKRKAVFAVLKYLCDSGVTPEAIENVAPNVYTKPLFLVSNGNVSAQDFVDQQRVKDVRFDKYKYFCGDDQLIRSGAITYAFTGQWWEPIDAINALSTAFPDKHISCTESL